MPGIGRRDYEQMLASEGQFFQGLRQDRVAQQDRAHQARLGQQTADLNLRNQMIINQQQEEEQIRAERRELAEIQRQKAEWSFGDKTTDFLIKAGDYPRINEKMAQDSQFANEFATIMKDESTDWGQKVRAIYAAEAAASRRIAIRQTQKTPQQQIEEQMFTVDMSKYGGVGKKIIMPKGFIMGDVEGGGSFGSLDPQDPSIAQNFNTPEGFDGPPLPEFGLPMPDGYQGPMPKLRPWKPEAANTRVREIMEDHEGGISRKDARILAEMDRYEASGVDPSWNPEFAKAYAIAEQHSEEVAAAKRAKMAGTNKPPDTPSYPTDFDTPYTEAEIKEAFTTINKQATEYTDKDGKTVPMPKEDYWNAVRDRLMQNRRAVVIGDRERRQKGEADLPAKPFQNEQPVWVWPYGGGGQPTATPGMTPTPRATPGPASPGGEDERRARAKARNDELKAMNISAEVRRAILLQEGLIDQ